MFGKKRRLASMEAAQNDGEGHSSVEPTNPFENHFIRGYDVFDGHYILSVFGVEINPATYGVEDLEASRANILESGEFAVLRVVQLGETLGEERLESLRYVAELLTLVRSVLAASLQPLEPSEAEIIERANNLIHSILSDIFQPLITEQQQRKAENAAFQERQMQEMLAERAALLGELASRMADTSEPI